MQTYVTILFRPEYLQTVIFRKVEKKLISI